MYVASPLQVQVASVRIIDHLSLRLLTKMIASNGESVVLGQIFERLYGSLAGRALLHSMRHRHEAQTEIRTNKPLQHLHAAMTTRSAISGLLARLPMALTNYEDALDRLEDQ